MLCIYFFHKKKVMFKRFKVGSCAIFKDGKWEPHTKDALLAVQSVVQFHIDNYGIPILDVKSVTSKHGEFEALRSHHLEYVFNKISDLEMVYPGLAEIFKAKAK